LRFRKLLLVLDNYPENLGDYTKYSATVFLTFKKSNPMALASRELFKTSQVPVDRLVIK